MLKYTLLSSLSFGKVDSESEDALDKIFIQTDDFSKFLNKDTFVILGAKGAGKSALFRLFTVFEDSARKMAGNLLNDTYIISGTGFKDISNMDYDEIYSKMQNGNFDFQSAWKIYLVFKLVYGLYDKGNIICGNNSRDLLIRAEKVKDYRLFGIIKKLFNAIVGDIPQIEELSFKDVSIRISKNRKIAALDVLKEIDNYLKNNNKTVWILLDKIDELFSERHLVRKQCIEGLFLTLIDFISRFSNIKLKIFLRTDIWETLNFVNKSHLTDKRIILSWDSKNLSGLLVKRACLNKEIETFILNRTGFDNINRDYERCYYAIFEQRAYPGEREAPTLNYMIDRTTDGQGGVYPRELINFCNYAKDFEIRKTAEDEEIEDGVLISGLSVRNAFPLVSKTKVKSYLSEFSWLSKHFQRFEGATKAEFTREELFELMKGLDPSMDDMLRQLYETGILKPNSSVITAATKFEIPRLFRIGLGVVVPGRP